MRPDVEVNDCGSVVMFAPMTAEAQQWVDTNVGLESWQWLGGAFAVEHRYADDLIEGMLNDGLVVK